jgi:uncharacterized protein YndB with AHSA1/START domain
MTDPVSVEAEVPGTPEEVWAMIATARGLGTWFVPTDLEQREGGNVVFHLGEDFDAPGTVTAWSPPERWRVEEPWPTEGAPEDASIATEFLVEARAGGTCVVRIVTTFIGADPGDDLSGVGDGWTSALFNLNLCLTHFAGQDSAPAAVTLRPPVSSDEAWEAVLAAVGDVELDAVVERRAERELVLRRPSSLLSFYSTSWEDQTLVFMRGTCFGPAAERDAAQETAHWEAQLQRVLAPA